ncbi:hypothetical protein AN639_02725 [Epulopiscium sp. SCG-B05WGA-EpuloA1]|uniref:Uncharacterized protein n=1 Tax=Candidatus Epulonipiscium fishelsonii TaxID=77094 RepID=A0ACC8XEY4_9FIRM|nr:hypothetical protein AN396_03580 [Epulopiscium sp. SCG-B11WGA-EpuloA1]ONI41939.1 hypothetical protein AN639_02725 [Epulopiscium sp. SCG-B05WGA-EpuloA1]
MEQLKNFKDFIKKIENLRQASLILKWDMETCMPKNGAEANIAAITYLSNEAFKLSISDEMKNYLDELSKEQNFSKMDNIFKTMIIKEKKEFDKTKNVPLELATHMTEVCQRSQNTWFSAKPENNFNKMIPYFREIVMLAKEISRYKDPNKSAYDVLIDKFEQDMDTQSVEKLFSELKDGIVPLIEAISEKKQFDDSKFKGTFEKYRQKELSYYFMDVVGYDLNSGVLGEAQHPFAMGNSPFDVRITTNYHLDDVRPALFSILHECGHAIYEQNLSTNLVGTFLNRGTTMGMHESQSRFYENIIGRNKNFWVNHYDKLGQILPYFKSIPRDEFYRGVNKVEPSLVRIQADELTYNLHIIIRFELEKALFDGTLSVKDLPTAWHDKMKSYLGVEPTSHQCGVLQDVHWPSGLFGYFPSYALGNIYSGQFLMQIEKELGNFDELLINQKIPKITSWLTKNIHQYGKMKTPKEIIRDTCNSEIDVKPIIKYYTNKFTELYDL